MPTPIKPIAKAGASVSAAKPTSYVKFSDKLTMSLNDIAKMIEEHKVMIDSIQEVALELTNSIGTLHTLTVKYAGIANNILDGLLPIVKNLPLIPKNITALLVNLEAITQKIIDSQASTSKTMVESSQCTSARVTFRTVVFTSVPAFRREAKSFMPMKRKAT